jgi:hypothetical protein
MKRDDIKFMCRAFAMSWLTVVILGFIVHDTHEFENDAQSIEHMLMLICFILLAILSINVANGIKD